MPATRISGPGLSKGGPEGRRGLKGDKPAYELDGLRIRWERPDGTPGDWIDLNDVVGLRFQGDWDAATAYENNDLVRYGNATYVARRDSLGAEPGTSDLDWRLFVPGGTVGDGAVTDATVATPANPDQGIKATKLSYKGPWDGAAPAFISDLLSDELHGRKFGIRGDMSDETAKINALFEAAWQEGKVPRLGKGLYGVRNSQVNACLVSKTPRLLGNGPSETIIFPLEGTTRDADIWLIDPPAGAYEYTKMEGFLVYPGLQGVKRGRHGIKVDANRAANISYPEWRNVYVQDANNFSVNLAITHEDAAWALFEFNCCHFYNGIKARHLGDTGAFNQCKFHVETMFDDITGESISGADIHTTDHVVGGNFIRPSVLVFDRPNYTGTKAFLRLRNGLHVKVRDPNIECWAGGLGGANNAVIELTGEEGEILRFELTGGLVSAFGAGNIVTDLVHVGNVREGRADNVQFLHDRPSPRSAIYVSGNAKDFQRGRNGYDGNFQQHIFDEGQGTIGNARALVLQAPFASSDLLGTAQYEKTADGYLHLRGGLTAPGGGAAGQVVGTLPVGYRPSKFCILPIIALTSSGRFPAELQIGTDGVVRYDGPAAFDRLPLDGASFRL